MFSRSRSSLPLLSFLPVLLPVACLIALMFTLWTTQLAHAATITVNGGCTLTNAIISANDDTATGGCVTGSGTDTIVLDDITYPFTTTYEDYLVSGNVALPTIVSSIVISGNGATLERTIASCPSSTESENFRLLTVYTNGSDQGHLTLHDLTLTNGCASGFINIRQSGGAILLYGGTLIAENTHILSNTALSDGGGVALFGNAGEDRTATFINSEIRGNRAGSLGGGIAGFEKSSITLNGTDVVANHATSSGGGLLNITLAGDGFVLVQGSRLLDNTATSGGAAVYNDADSFTIEDSCIVGNDAFAVQHTNAITGTINGNWWGAAQGPSGDFPGTGDQANGAFSMSSFETSSILGCRTRTSDLRATRVQSPPEPTLLLPGQTITVTATITNAGPDVAHRVTFTQNVTTTNGYTKWVKVSAPTVKVTTLAQVFPLTTVLTFTIPSDLLAPQNLTLSQMVGPNFDPTPLGLGLITRAITLPTASLNTASLLVTETVGTVAIPIRLNFVNPYADSVLALHSSNLSATAGSDYTAVSQTVIIPAGQQSASVNLTILEDSAVEGDEALRLTLTPLSGVRVGTPSLTTVTISQNDLVASLAVSKRANRSWAEVGDTITYTYRITNTGNVNLDLVATDNPLGPITLQPTVLTPNQVATGQLVVVAEAVGTLVNTLNVTATATSLSQTIYGSAEETVDVLAEINAALRLTKTVGIQGIQPACTNLTTRQVPISTTVIYCYTMTNTGNVPLTHHTLTDSHLGTIAVDQDFVLQPGASMNSLYAQMLVASVTNVATWTASVDEGATVALFAPLQEEISVTSSAQATVTISDDNADQDGDGIPDNVESADDRDSDNIPNFLDTDSDNDGRSDAEEAGPDPRNPLDSNNNGLPDYLDSPDLPPIGEQLRLPMIRGHE